jgi:hypothetical protein
MLTVEKMGIEVAILPKDITGAAQEGDWISLKKYRHATIILLQGAWAGGTPAVILEQATDVSGTDAKALGFTRRWTQVGITGTGYSQEVVASNTFTLPNTANTMHVLEVSAAELDTDNGFDCLRVTVASPGANADLLAALYLLGGARYSGQTMPDAKVD